MSGPQAGNIEALKLVRYGVEPGLYPLVIGFHFFLSSCLVPFAALFFLLELKREKKKMWNNDGGSEDDINIHEDDALRVL